jgi:hypothetical protein
VQSGRYVVEVKAAFDKERPSRKQRYEVGRSAARMKEWVGQRAREVETAEVQLAQAAAGNAAYIASTNT